MKTLLHRLVAQPVIYDLAQKIAGAGKCSDILREELVLNGGVGRVLDIGGGTGLHRPLWPADCEFCCLDPDPLKLKRFRAKFPRDTSMQAYAGKIPAERETFDYCMMTLVSHHLTAEELRQAFGEVKRVMRPKGLFLFMDAFWNPKNRSGRLLWSLDRGSYPKSKRELEIHIERTFSVQSCRMWKIHHDYILFWCQKLDLED